MMYNKNMKKGRLKRGFTLIEVVLFLAISSAVFAVIMANTSINVAKRRYHDNVNSIAEEIRNAYSAAINVENYRRKTEDSSFFCSVSSAFEGTSEPKPNSSTIETGKNKTDNNPGRSRCAVYGQLITFGESNDSRINRYDIIGLALENDIEPEGNDDVLSSLRSNAKANIVTMKNHGTSVATCSAGLAGTTSYYVPDWTGRIENKNDRKLYRGAIMIVRSPVSGTIHTYFYSANGSSFDADGSVKDNPDYDESFFVQKWLETTPTGACSGFYRPDDYFVYKAIKENKMVKNANLEVCVGSEDLFSVGNKRRAIRIHGDGSNEAAVEVLSEGESVSVCKEV